MTSRAEEDEFVIGEPHPERAESLVTYKRADGSPVAGEFGWVTDIEFFEDDDEPIEVVEERWMRTEVRTRWFFPPGYCFIEDGDSDPCEATAVVYGRERGGEWGPLCEQHKTALGPDAEYADV